MRREHRLRRRVDFAAVYRSGKVEGNRLLVVRARPREQGPARFGFAVGKAVGGAVVRNRVKRRLRAACDTLPVAEGLDIVIGARAAAANADYAALRQSLLTLLRRAGALDGAAEEHR
jgi:ribonuclease P protein component